MYTPGMMLVYRDKPCGKRKRTSHKVIFERLVDGPSQQGALVRILDTAINGNASTARPVTELVVHSLHAGQRDCELPRE